MPAINPNRYPLDYTGQASTNAVEGETVVLQTRPTRVFVPQQAPYFASSMEIVDTSTGTVLTALQWKPVLLHSVATGFTPMGKEVYIAVAIVDQAVGNNLLINYQTVGYDYVTGFENIIELLQGLNRDNRPVTWPNVIDVEEISIPNKHLHPISNTHGWEFVTAYLEELRTAILLGDKKKRDVILEYIDLAIGNSNAVASAMMAPSSTFGQHVNQLNAHGVTATLLNLQNVVNYPLATLQEALDGIRNDRYLTVSQAAQVVVNAVNGGINAHIGRTDNPHGLTKAQLLLGLVENYPIALADDINNPLVGTPKYVTNLTLGPWLTAKSTEWSSRIDTAMDGFDDSITAATVSANTAVEAAQEALETAQAALLQANRSVTRAEAGAIQASQNLLEITTAKNEVQDLYETYLVTAMAQARAEGYSAGFADGQATG